MDKGYVTYITLSVRDKNGDRVEEYDGGDIYSTKVDVDEISLRIERLLRKIDPEYGLSCG